MKEPHHLALEYIVNIRLKSEELNKSFVKALEIWEEARKEDIIKRGSELIFITNNETDKRYYDFIKTRLEYQNERVNKYLDGEEK